MENEIQHKLKDAFCPTWLKIENQSHLHAGHSSSPNTGQSHFHVTIVSESFNGLSKVQRHRKIYDVLKPMLNEGIHALGLSTFTPDEWEKIS